MECYLLDIDDVHDDASLTDGAIHIEVTKVE